MRLLDLDATPGRIEDFQAPVHLIREVEQPMAFGRECPCLQEIAAARCSLVHANDVVDAETGDEAIVRRGERLRPSEASIRVVHARAELVEGHEGDAGLAAEVEVLEEVEVVVDVEIHERESFVLEGGGGPDEIEFGLTARHAPAPVALFAGECRTPGQVRSGLIGDAEDERIATIPVVVLLLEVVARIEVR